MFNPVHQEKDSHLLREYMLELYVEAKDYGGEEEVFNGNNITKPNKEEQEKPPVKIITLDN